MIVQIFRNNTLVAAVKPLDSSELQQEKQTKDQIMLKFVLSDFVDIRVGDYISFEKTKQIYVINQSPEIIESPKNYNYTCYFEGAIQNLYKTKILLETEKAEGGYYRDYKFSLTGNSQTFLDFIVSNLNRNSTSEIITGDFEPTETKTFEFNNWNAFEAITELSSSLNFNWYLESNVLHFAKKQNNITHLLQVGRRKGAIELTRMKVSNNNIETVVYGYGGTQNMPPRVNADGLSYDSNLLKENRLCFDGVDGESKLEKNVELYGRIESVQEFDEIHPKRTGTVTGITENLRTFYDTNIEFDINETLISGINPKITFNTGKLAGLTFNISFDNSTKAITVDYYSNESGQYPNEIIFASIGDSYKLFDVIMPQNYIDEAKVLLRQTTQDYIDLQSKSVEAYEAKLDPQDLQENGTVLNIGDTIRIVSDIFKIDDFYEIKELTQNISKPFNYSIKFGDILPKSLLYLFRTNNFSIQQSIYNVSNNSVTNNQLTNVIGGETLVWQPIG